METVYLDNAATMPMRKEALEAMMPFFGADYGNPASIHSMSRSPRKAVNEAREKIAKVLNMSVTTVYSYHSNLQKHSLYPDNTFDRIIAGL
jgi:cysteine desulfurase